MNSVILSFIYGFVLRLYDELLSSRFWGLLCRIHTFFRKNFNKSLIVNTVKYGGGGEVERTSLMCTLLRIPTAVVSAVCRIFSKAVRSFAENSVLAALGRGYTAGFLALDVRFFGIMLFSAGISSCVFSVLRDNAGAAPLIMAAVGAVLFFVRIKLADYLDKSVTVRFIKASLGFEDISFRVCTGAISKYVYFSGAIAGLFAGLGSINAILYALPAAAFGLTALMCYPISGIFFAFFLAPILPTMAVVGICVLTVFSSLCRRAYTGNFRINMGRCGICLMLFLVIAFISTLFSFAHKGSIGVFGMYLIFIGFYYCVLNSVKSRNTIEGILKIFALSAAIVSVYGIMQYAFGWTTKNAWIDTDMFESSTMRAYSTLANPNVLGEYLILALPVCALVFVRWARGTWQKIVYALFFAAALLCLVLTQSRGCWIGFFLSAAIFVTYYRSELWKVLPFIIILLPFVLPDTVINRLLSVGDMSDSSTSYRVYIWFGTLLMLRCFWLGGIGPGEAAFRSVYPYYSYMGIIAPHSHNLYLQLVVDSGIANLLVFLACMLLFFKDMINIQRTGRDKGLIAAALMSGVAGFLVQSMFDYTFYNYRVMGIFFMVLALGGALVRISEKEETALEKDN
ncbi:MAG: O-antigen ligase family protein [Clostridia bacterium]|nr:O-antigen ligase family protein [Clostridia bacterium]